MRERPVVVLGPTLSLGLRFGRRLRMSEDVVEMMHHQRVRIMRLELVLTPPGRKRSQLLVMVARAQAMAEAHGWSNTAD